MTIDEAIDGLKRIFSNYELDLPCTDSLDIESRIIVLLEELKAYRENSNGYNKEDIELNRKAMYNKAIDDFVNACKEDILFQIFGLHINGIERIAEQLKERD